MASPNPTKTALLISILLVTVFSLTPMAAAAASESGDRHVRQRRASQRFGDAAAIYPAAAQRLYHRAGGAAVSYVWPGVLDAVLWDGDRRDGRVWISQPDVPAFHGVF